MTDTSTTIFTSARVRDLCNRLQIMWLITEGESNNVQADYRVARLVACAVRDGEITDAEGAELTSAFYVDYCAI